MLNLDGLPTDVKVIERTDRSLNFFTKPITEGGLGLLESQIYNINDTDRYDVRVYEQSNDENDIGKYQRRINVDDLKQLDHGLIYFGSMFGSGRVRVNSGEMRKLFVDLWESMVFQNEFLDSISKRISHMLGGRDEYIGLHLRVGDGVFMVRSG
jgi:hypothetical protein